jgi:EmrB/QacA subfamily drug resistance transporter
MHEQRRRWLALTALCLGELLIVLDSTIVNVALPSIRTDLGFADSTLVWVVNAFMLTFGGFLLLGGRLGDLFGGRKLFLTGIALFTLASLACGLAQTPAQLIAARLLQGMTGAIVSAVALSLMVNLFPEPNERAKAMGFYGFVMAAGGSVGVLLGGLITGLISWHWVFLINVPIGIAVLFLARRLLPVTAHAAQAVSLDFAGAFTITAALMLAVYGVVEGNNVGWLSLQTLAVLGVAVALLIAFLVIEARSAAPLVPLSLFRRRNTTVANVVGVLWAVAMFAWFFYAALYLQRVLGYAPLQVGMAFLPTNLMMAIFSLGLSAKVVLRFGLRVPMVLGLALSAIGLALFALAPTSGEFARHVLPGMLLLGIGTGLAFNPVLLAAMGDVDENESGLASGVVNTSFMMGGALGLAMVVALAVAVTSSVQAAGVAGVAALNSGYQAAFWAGAVCAALAALIALALREPARPVAVAH